MKKFLTLSLILIPTLTYAQKTTLIYSLKSTQAQVWTNSLDFCNYANLTVERKEETNKNTVTTLSYVTKNCDGSVAEKGEFITIPNGSYTIDTRKRIHTLNTTTPINVSLTWIYPVDWKNSFSGTWTALSPNNETQIDTQVAETISARPDGLVSNKNISTGFFGSVTISTSETSVK